MRIERFKAAHLRTLELQDSQAYFVTDIASAEYARNLEIGGNGFTALDGDRVIGCAGCIEVWENRAMAWALISKDAGRNFMGIHRAVSGFLAAAKWRRIEAYVDVGFAPGMRWMDMLGFTNETPGAPMKAFRPDGNDCYLFSKVK